MKEKPQETEPAKGNKTKQKYINPFLLLQNKIEDNKFAHKQDLMIDNDIDPAHANILSLGA